METPDIIVTLPPPTPNGGLHVGHMAGPFLTADIFAKAMQAAGQSVHVLSYSDTNQSYVRVTAEKQNCDPHELASRWTKDILATLAAYGCQVDQYFEPDAASNGFVREIVLDLYQSGQLAKRPYPFIYSLDREIFLDEAGVSGLCPRCLDNSKCGICEACGFPTRADTLIAPYATNAPDESIEVRDVVVLVLDLEQWRDALRAFHSFPDPIRPKYRWLVDDALAESLPMFPMTVPGDWGIPADHPDLPGQVINAWPELVLDFVYGYKRVEGDGDPPKIVNFFGYDNSYFYAIVHVALLHAAGLTRYLPAATMINEFYNLENEKFSTSRGHLIWARDLAQSTPSDLVRFFCALTSPGFEQGNFNRVEMDEVLNRRLLKPYAAIAVAIANKPGTETAAPRDSVRTIANAVEARVAHSLTLERFQLRHAAEDALKGLRAINHGIERLGLTRTEGLFLLKSWARAIAPIMPDTAEQLANMLARDRIPLRLPCDQLQKAEKQTEEFSHA